MTNEDRVEQMLSRITETQLAILKVQAYLATADEPNRTQRAIRLRRECDFSVDLLSEITGVRPDNLRKALKREDLL